LLVVASWGEGLESLQAVVTLAEWQVQMPCWLVVALYLISIIRCHVFDNNSDVGVMLER
jgi:hypothetical protein